MTYNDLAWILDRFDSFNDSVVTSFLIHNNVSDRFDVTLEITAHDSFSNFEERGITLDLFEVSELKLNKVERYSPFLLSFGATFIAFGGFHYMEFGGNGEPKTISEMECQDIFVKFKHCSLSKISGS